jgi:hypothetical protein
MGLGYDRTGDTRMEQDEVILGVDTHLDTHVGAVISDTGRLPGTLSVWTGTAGYPDLLRWANSFGQFCRAGVEGTGSYGAGLARVLRDHEIGVPEGNRPDRAMRAAVPVPGDNHWNDPMTQRRITDDPAAFHVERSGQ